jgi:hypothetical protein
VEAEQYLDFLGNRTFRHTLLCHQEIEIHRKIGPAPDRIATMYLGVAGGTGGRARRAERRRDHPVPRS